MKRIRSMFVVCETVHKYTPFIGSPGLNKRQYIILHLWFLSIKFYLHNIRGAERYSSAGRFSHASGDLGGQTYRWYHQLMSMDRIDARWEAGLQDLMSFVTYIDRWGSVDLGLGGVRDAGKMVDNIKPRSAGGLQIVWMISCAIGFKWSWYCFSCIELLRSRCMLILCNIFFNAGLRWIRTPHWQR